MESSQPIVPMNDLSRRFESDTELVKSVTDLIVNGPYLNSKFTGAFESEFARFVGVEFCIAVSSGTAALELAIKALELPANSVILMTANAGGYSAIAARNAGHRTRYIDVDEFGLLGLHDLNQNLEDVSAIVVTHLYGQMCDMNALSIFASQNNLKVIEDCAQAVGSRYGGIPAGAFGDVSAFSFYPTKNLGGIGDSGAVCTKSQSLANRVRKLREYGWSERYFSAVSGGGNFRNDEIQSLVLLEQLTSLHARNTIRKKIWNRYFEICNLYGFQILGSTANDFVPHLAVLKISIREEFIKHMNERNISVAIHYPFPDFLQPGLILEEVESLIRTTLHCNQVVSIPLFPEMTEAEICQVEEGLSDFFGRVHD
jgi:dTDP-4-amino-4,6-dideoxygalactose transaminase